MSQDFTVRITADTTNFQPAMQAVGGQLQTVAGQASNAQGQLARLGDLSGPIGSALQQLSGVAGGGGFAGLSTSLGLAATAAGAFSGGIAGVAVALGQFVFEQVSAANAVDRQAEAMREAAEFAERYNDVIRTTNGLLPVLASQATAAGQAQRDASLLALSGIQNELEGRRYLLNQEIARANANNPNPLQQTDALGNFIPGATGTGNFGQSAGLLEQLDAINQALGELGTRRSLLERTQIIPGQMTPDAPAAPGREGAGRTTRELPQYGPGMNDFIASQRQIANEATRLYEQTRTPEEQRTARLERYNELLSQGAVDQDTYNRAVAALEPAAEQATQSFGKLNSAIANALEDFINGTKTFGEAVKSLAMDISKLVIRSTVTGPLSTLLGNGAGALGTELSAAFGGARAAGGPVDPSQWYVVGERGPEVFRPSRAGTIIPNGAAAGGGDTHIWNISTPDADSFRRSPAQVAGAASDLARLGGRLR